MKSEKGSEIHSNDQYEKLYKSIHDAHRYTFILHGAFGSSFLNWCIRTSHTPKGYILFPCMLDGKDKDPEAMLIDDNWMQKALIVDIEVNEIAMSAIKNKLPGLMGHCKIMTVR
jgi:hypothetical protein